MRYLLFLLVSIVVVSCDNDFELVADYKETPVVYGIIDQGDSIQYIRVERAFIDKSISANTIAQNADSLYYDDITVKLVRVKTGEEYTLERVDGNEIGLQRDLGVFANDPNYLYQIRTDAIPLIAEEQIQIRVEGVFEDRAVTAMAPILKPAFFINPSNESVIGFLRNRKSNVGWSGKNDPQDYDPIFSVIYSFDVNEERNGVTTTKTLDWVVERNTERTVIEIEGIDFYSFMLGALEKDPAVTRSMGLAKFSLIEGNKAVADYIRVGLANTGLTSSGEIPIFTNMSEGLGLFGSSITQERTNLSISQTTLDSLRMSPLTAELNFE